MKAFESTDSCVGLAMSMRKAVLIFSDKVHQLCLMPPLIALFFVAPFIIIETAHAQSPSLPITSSGLNTVVATNDNVHNITGGTRPSGGENLFHSFGVFGVPPDNIANFLNGVSFDLNGTPLPAGLETSNILARVTGNIQSDIFGTIQTTGFSKANLFLMNPAGIVFAPEATLHVGGTVAFTTADYLRLTDGAQFKAVSNGAADALLSNAPVAAFGFLESNPGSITVRGSQFNMSERQGISLIGGNIEVTAGTLDDGTVQPAQLSAPGGQINLASVASEGEVLLTDLRSISNIDGQSFTTMGKIILSQGTTLTVKENAAGTIRIRGGQLMMDQGTISADTVKANGAAVAIDINVTGDLSIANVDIPALTARTTGSGDAGRIQVSSANMNIVATGPDNPFVSIIDAHTSGSGKAGKVNIATGDLTVGDPSGASFPFLIDSGTSGHNTGSGGDVEISAHTIQAQDITLASTGNFVASLNGGKGAGVAGNITISADSLQLVRSQIVTDSSDFMTGTGKAGDITLRAHAITLDSSSLSSAGQEQGGAIVINTDRLHATGSHIVTQTKLMDGGPVNISGDIVELMTGSTVVSSTGGDGHAGSITITATDHLSLLAEPVTNNPSGTFNNPSGIFSNSDADSGATLGNAGNIFISTPKLEITNGSRVDTTTATSGLGGNVTIRTTDSISVAGETGALFPDTLFNLGAIKPSGVFTRTIGGHCSGPCGNAGNVSITTDSLSMGAGAQINSGTSSSGQGGNIAVTAANTIAMSGTLTTGQPGGIQSRTIGTASDSGGGGNITLLAGQSVIISDGASVSAGSTGPGNAGNIFINGGQQFEMRDGSITTQATKASGGNIDIQAVERVRLVNSPISTSVLGGAGSGGNITIDPNVIVLQNSDITAKAVQGAGGNITLTTPLFLRDSSSQVDASSQFGLNGTVTIQSPTSNVSGSLGPLTSKPSQAQALLTQRCAALASGQASSFVVAGREQLPSDPGGWLSSPLAFAALGENPDADNAVASISTVMAIAADNTSTLSLRRLTPAGFLMANFADSAATGCHS